MSRFSPPAAARQELCFTTTARLTRRIEAALKYQSGLSMPNMIFLMTSRATAKRASALVLAHKVVFSLASPAMKRANHATSSPAAPARTTAQSLVFLTDAGKRLFDGRHRRAGIIRRLFLNESPRNRHAHRLFSRVRRAHQQRLAPCPMTQPSVREVATLFYLSHRLSLVGPGVHPPAAWFGPSPGRAFGTLLEAVSAISRPAVFLTWCSAASSVPASWFFSSGAPALSRPYPGGRG